MAVIKLLTLLTLWAGVTALPWGNKTVVKFDSHADNMKYRDCHEWHQAGYRRSGTYEIWVHDKYSVKVYCQNIGNTSATVIHRREYGDFSFQQSWTSYANGFGHMPPARGDFWLGLNTINYLTSHMGNTILTFVMQDWSHNIKQESYRDFRVMDPSQRYRMYVGAKIFGSLPDDFSFNNGMPFATEDTPDANYCALHQRAGWWFNYCTYTLPTGRYYFGGKYKPSGAYYDGIFWKDWYGYDYSLNFISMSVSHP